MDKSNKKKNKRMKKKEKKKKICAHSQSEVRRTVMLWIFIYCTYLQFIQKEIYLQRNADKRIINGNKNK